jgi:hypothetical protein
VRGAASRRARIGVPDPVSARRSRILTRPPHFRKAAFRPPGIG